MWLLLYVLNITYLKGNSDVGFRGVKKWVYIENIYEAMWVSYDMLVKYLTEISRQTLLSLVDKTAFQWQICHQLNMQHSPKSRDNTHLSILYSHSCIYLKWGGNAVGKGYASVISSYWNVEVCSSCWVDSCWSRFRKTPWFFLMPIKRARNSNYVSPTLVWYHIWNVFHYALWTVCSSRSRNLGSVSFYDPMILWSWNYYDFLIL